MYAAPRPWGIHTRMRTPSRRSRTPGFWDRRSFLTAAIGAAATAPVAAQPAATAQPPAALRHVVGRRRGLEWRRTLSGLERHPEQRADALARGRQSRHGVPQS